MSAGVCVLILLIIVIKTKHNCKYISYQLFCKVLPSTLRPPAPAMALATGPTIAPQVCKGTHCSSRCSSNQHEPNLDMKDTLLLQMRDINHELSCTQHFLQCFGDGFLLHINQNLN